MNKFWFHIVCNENYHIPLFHDTISGQQNFAVWYVKILVLVPKVSKVYRFNAIQSFSYAQHDVMKYKHDFSFG